ncbi:MAG TPA: glycolate oxidase subunit GlcE [Roseiarcus sp.]|nr:glycolate oxidase subunit GlcE [Roseiarcus sp.]
MTLTSDAILAPSSEEEAAEIARQTRARSRKLTILGGGSRAGLGRPWIAHAALSTSRLSGVVFYEPAEMTISVRAGTPLAEIEKRLAQHSQMLPFEPMDHRALYASLGEPTIGGVVAANISGPRRISAGAARDSLIGLRLVNGRGEAIKSGGRVMKNVTGLDLVKLICGAHGTLGLVTEATFKLLPRPEREASIVIRRLEDQRAVEAMTAALGSAFGVSGAAHIAAGMGREFPRTFLRVEGFAASVEHRTGELLKLLEPFGAKHALDDVESGKFWRAARDCEFLVEPRERAIWRVSIAPSKGAAFVARLGAFALAHFYDWGGGLVWIAAEPSRASAEAIRSTLSSFDGHATLIRAPDPLRESVDVFQPPAPTVLRLTREIKASFDPDGIFNAGRMYPGI